MSVVQRIVDQQVRLSRAFDRWLPAALSVDGNQNFLREVLPAYLQQGLVVADVGGGKHPCVSAGVKHELGLTLVGLDISRSELEAAPPGIYDEIFCADICHYRGAGACDLVVCQALLEHVPNVQSAFNSLASLLKPGGKLLVFVPCRNALFARLNLLLPEAMKRRILYTVFPNSKQGQGFRSYYNRCTPRDFIALGAESGLVLNEFRGFYMSAYFSFFLPFHLLWRLWSLVARKVVGTQAVESFVIVFRRMEHSEEG